MTKLVRIGTSYGVRIPKIFMEKVNLKDADIDLKLCKNGLLLTPSKKYRANWDTQSLRKKAQQDKDCITLQEDFLYEDTRGVGLVMRQFEIFWIDLDPAKGQRNRQKRPCVIISPNELNYLQTRLIAPITSKGFDAPFRINFTLEGKNARILCDQIRCVSVDRFLDKICDLEQKLRAILVAIFS